jgi:hypothetical protein
MRKGRADMIDKQLRNQIGATRERLEPEHRDALREFGYAKTVDESIRLGWQHIAKHPALPGVFRRNLLKGLGASALLAPFVARGLLAPARARAQQLAPEPDNLLLVTWPCGMQEPYQVSATGTGYSFSNMLRPLEPYRDKLLIYSGMQAGHDGPVVLSHSRGPQAMWTGMRTTAGTHDFARGPSVEQAIARQIGQDRAYATIHAGVQVNWRRSGFAIPYVHYAGANQPINPIQDPLELYRLIASRAPDKPGDDSQAQRRLEQHSILDVLRGDLDSLRPRVSAQDLVKLEQHTEHLRSIERTLSSFAMGPNCAAPAMPALVGSEPSSPAMKSENFAAVSRNQIELLALAFQCGLTKVATLQLSETDSQLVVPNIPKSGVMGPGASDVADSVHGVVHFGNDEQSVAAMSYFVDRLAEILDVLQSRPLADGVSVLDRTLVVMTTEMNVPQHGFLDVPVYIAGGSKRFFKYGSHIDIAGNPRPGRLLVTLMRYFGIEQETFGDGDGDSRGVLGELLA